MIQLIVVNDDDKNVNNANRNNNDGCWWNKTKEDLPGLCEEGYEELVR